jgi:hypothetical protein
MGIKIQQKQQIITPFGGIYFADINTICFSPTIFAPAFS